MSMLTGTKWENGDGLMELKLWGAQPCLSLVNAAVDHIDQYGGDNDDFLRDLLCLMRDRLEEMSEKLQEFHQGGPWVQKTH